MTARLTLLAAVALVVFASIATLTLVLANGINQTAVLAALFTTLPARL